MANFPATITGPNYWWGTTPPPNNWPGPTSVPDVTIGDLIEDYDNRPPTVDFPPSVPSDFDDIVRRFRDLQTNREQERNTKVESTEIKELKDAVTELKQRILILEEAMKRFVHVVSTAEPADERRLDV